VILISSKQCQFTLIFLVRIFECSELAFSLEFSIPGKLVTSLKFILSAFEKSLSIFFSPTYMTLPLSVHQFSTDKSATHFI
jgi:hypothetical protein